MVFCFLAYIYIPIVLNAPYSVNKSIAFSHLVVRIENCCNLRNTYEWLFICYFCVQQKRYTNVYRQWFNVFVLCL